MPKNDLGAFDSGSSGDTPFLLGGRTTHETAAVRPAVVATPDRYWELESPFQLADTSESAVSLETTFSESEGLVQAAPPGTWQTEFGDTVRDSSARIGASVTAQSERVADQEKSCACDCGRGTSAIKSFPEELSTETELEATEAFEGENLVSAGLDCSKVSVDCLDNEPAFPKVRPHGRPEGFFRERTEGDPRANFALQLTDYDINAYQPRKPRHQEALTRIREFIVNRAATTDQGIAVTITGSASRTGGKTYNDVLSCKRAICAASNLRQALLQTGVLNRVQINSSGEGFTRATCNGSQCELDEWRSVLIQVHAPNNPPQPIPTEDPGWDKYTIRCCSFHTIPAVTELLGELLKKGLPRVPDRLRGPLQTLVKKGISKLIDRLLKGLPKLESLVSGLSEMLKLFPGEFVHETGVFEIRERKEQNARALVLCYSGTALRISVPRAKLDDLIDDAFGKISPLRLLPEGLKKQLRERIKSVIPGVVQTAIQPIESDTPGKPARFDLTRPRRLQVFEGSVEVGKGFWMPGQVNVEFNSPIWRSFINPRPVITNCPDTDCNDSGVQCIVGNRRGSDLFSISFGELKPGSCVCGVPGSAQQGEALPQTSLAETAGGFRQPASPFSLGETGEMAGEMEGEMEGAFSSMEANIAAESLFATPSQERAMQEASEWESGVAESPELDPYLGIRSAMAPEHANLTADEITSAFGRTPAVVAIHWLLASSELQQAVLAALLGKVGRRSIRIHGSDMPISSYLRLVARLCREVAQQREAEDAGESPPFGPAATELPWAPRSAYAPEAGVQAEGPGSGLQSASGAWSSSANQSVRDVFFDFSAQFEGKVHWMYLDILGYVSTGIGNKIDPLTAPTLQLGWTDKDTHARADAATITAEWQTVQSRQDLKGKSYTTFEPITRLRLSDDVIARLVSAVRNEFEQVLVRTSEFSSFGGWPADAQLGLLSMGWALGPYFAPGWPKFRRDCAAPDFAQAALDSRMKEAGNPGLIPRNQANEMLFLFASRVLKMGLPLEQLIYPRILTSGGAILDMSLRSTVFRWPSLKKGISSQAVTVLQTLLFGAGSPSITGTFDDATVQAVKAFQAAHVDRDGKTLTSDGVVGANTWRALVYAN